MGGTCLGRDTGIPVLGMVWGSLCYLGFGVPMTLP